MANRPSLPALWNTAFSDPFSQGQTDSNIQLIPGSMGLPSQVDFILASASLNRDPTNFPFLNAAISRSAIREAAGKLKKYDGFTIGRYRVLATTNFNGHTFPAKFALHVFNPILKCKQQSYEGNVREITSFLTTTFLPELHRPVRPRDYRFSDRTRRIGSITYTITNGVWPKVEDPALQKLFHETQAGMVPIRDESIHMVRLAFFLFIFAVLPVGFYAVKRNKNNKQNTA